MDGILHGSEDDVENRKQRNRRVTHIKEDVKKVIRMLKDGKSPGVDNIPA